MFNSFGLDNRLRIVKFFPLLGLLILVLFGTGLAHAQTRNSISADPVEISSIARDPLDDFKSLFNRHGVALDGSLTQFYQGIVSGDGSKAWQYGGKGDLLATIDGAKVGLWRGLYFSIHQEWLYGEDANAVGDGSILALNTAMTFPRFGGHDRDTSINITQDFGDGFTLSLGKFNLLEAVAKTPLIGGGGLDTFIHLGLGGPITGVTPPYLLGSIASLKTDRLIVTGMIYDPRNAQDLEVLKSPFSDGVTASISATLPLEVVGLTGYYGLRGVYSTQEGVDFNSIPGLFLSSMGQSTGQSALTKKGYWYAAGSMQQFIFQDPTNPRSGWGVFAEGGISDGNPNPVKWHVFLGLGGNSLISGRHSDLWGIGYFTYSFSPQLTQALSILSLGIERERGLEGFYNYALTSRVRLTGDIQWIEPGRTDKHDAFISAVRLQTKF